MKLRQLESILSEVDTFDEPSIDLEQIGNIHLDHIYHYDSS